MTALHIATLALYLAAAGSALLLARRDPRHRPVAWYLCAVVAVDVLRWGRSLVLPPATGPREGWELVVRHAEQGLYLAAILALAAAAWAVFGGRVLHSEAKSRRYFNPERKSAHTSGAGSVTQSRGRRLARAWIRLRRGVSLCARWPGTGGGLIFLALWAYLIADYPDLRGAGLMRVYELVEVGAVLFSGLCFARWLSSPRLPREGLSPAVACTLALISGPAATVAAPYLTQGTTLESWPGIVAANGVAVAITLVLQIGALTRRRAKCSCYPS